MEEQNKLEDASHLLHKIGDGFLLTMLISFTGLWCFLYNFIIGESLNGEDMEKLICYFIIHLIITVFVFFVLVAYYAKARQVIDQAPELLFLRKIKVFGFYLDLVRTSARVLYIYWLPLILVCVYILVTISFMNVFLLVINLFLSLVLLYLISCRKNQEDINLGYPLFVILLFTCIYFFITVCISQGVIVEMDKSSYSPTDSIKITLVSKGYILLPKIQEVEFTVDSKVVVKRMYEGENYFAIQDIIDTNRKDRSNILKVRFLYKNPLGLKGWKKQRVILNSNESLE